MAKKISSATIDKIIKENKKEDKKIILKTVYPNKKQINIQNMHTKFLKAHLMQNCAQWKPREK